MKLETLLEKYLHSEFSFGYELEAIDEDKGLGNIRRLVGKTPGTDVSVKPTPNKPGASFEHQSEVMSFTPANIQKTENFLASLASNKIYTNKTCGFHVHFSWPRITSRDVFWILINLAIDERKQKEFLSLNGITFFNPEYASVSFLNNIKTVLSRKDYPRLKQYFEPGIGSKERVFRIHPQGTIEWRGPRNFIPSSGDFPVIKEQVRVFFKKTYSLLSYFSDVLSKTSNKYITREQMEKALDGAKEPFTTSLEKVGFEPGIISDKEAEAILKKYPWLRKAKFTEARFEDTPDGLNLTAGDWRDGEWKGNKFEGNFYGGTFNGRRFFGNWYKGKWKDGSFRGDYNENALIEIYKGSKNGVDVYLPPSRLTQSIAKSIK